MEPGIIHGDPATLLLEHSHGTIFFIFVSTGLCFVTCPRMGGVIMHMCVAQSLS